MTADEILTELRDIRRETVTGSGLRGEVSSYLFGRLAGLIRSIDQRSSPGIVRLSLRDVVRVKVLNRGRDVLAQNASAHGFTPDADGMLTLPFVRVIELFGNDLEDFTRQPAIAMEVEVIRS
jgi:hypothetical protein